MPVVQDGPPPGGFPSVRIARRIPSTGPGGFTVFAVSSAIMAYGFYLVRRRPLPPGSLSDRAPDDFQREATEPQWQLLLHQKDWRGSLVMGHRLGRL